jgi:proteasome lid subunit RPN8/RPN11
MTDIAPSCPRFPAIWTDEIAKAARAHTERVYPAEAAGMVANGQYVELENVSATPGEEVALDDHSHLKVAADAELFFHSHPDGLQCPSADDMLYQQQLGIPFVIQPWPEGRAFCFGDMLERAPLVGRAFRHGVHDCYAVIRDWYLAKGIKTLWDQPRGWQWWTKGQNLYTENFAQAGFVKIEPSEATEVGDLLLFSFNYGVPMHGALVCDKDLLLNHSAGARPLDHTRLSSIVPRSRWVRHATLALRYRGATT